MFAILSLRLAQRETVKKTKAGREANANHSPLSSVEWL